jgi:hypothetical protein
LIAGSAVSAPGARAGHFREASRHNVADPKPPAGSGSIDDKERTLDDRLGKIPLTTTPMTTAEIPLEQRPRKPCKYPVITKDIDLFVLAGSKRMPDVETVLASRIWYQCCIEFRIASRTFYDESQTKTLLELTPEEKKKFGDGLCLYVGPSEPSQAQQRLRNEWFKKRPRAAYAAVFAPKVSLTTNAAPSAADAQFDIVYMGERGDEQGLELAHELGHRLLGPSHADFRSPLMHPSRLAKEIDDLECRAARGDDKAIFEIMQRNADQQ